MSPCNGLCGWVGVVTGSSNLIWMWWWVWVSKHSKRATSKSIDVRPKMLRVQWMSLMMPFEFSFYPCLCMGFISFWSKAFDCVFLHALLCVLCICFCVFQNRRWRHIKSHRTSESPSCTTHPFIYNNPSTSPLSLWFIFNIHHSSHNGQRGMCGDEKVLVNGDGHDLFWCYSCFFWLFKHHQFQYSMLLQ